MGNKLQYLFRRGNNFTFRRSVPDDIRHIIGKGEVWISLGTGDQNLAKEEYGRIFDKIQKEFSRARRSLMPQEPKPLTSEMARLFAVSWFSPIFEEEVENAFKSLGEGNTRELLQELDEDEAHLTSSADEEIQPSLQATANKILFQNGYPVLDQPEDKSSRRRTPKQPNVDRRSDGYWALVNLVRRGEIELVRRLRDVLTGQPASKIYDPTFSSSIKAINSNSSLNPSPISVSDLFEQYLTSKGDQSKRTILDLRAAMRPLLEMIGPKTTANELKHQDFQEVFFLLKRLPTNATKGKSRQGKSLSEIADQAEKDGENLLHPKTINKYMARISAFMQWAEETGNCQIRSELLHMNQQIIRATSQRPVYDFLNRISRAVDDEATNDLIVSTLVNTSRISLRNRDPLRPIVVRLVNDEVLVRTRRYQQQFGVHPKYGAAIAELRGFRRRRG